MTAFSLRSVALGFVLLALMGLPSASRAQDATSGCPSTDPSTAPYAVVQIDTYPRLDLELARSPQEHELGLMYRETLAPDSGMLFIYTAQSHEGYWMYHTLLPLSIAWIDRDGTIVDIQDMPRLPDPNDEQAAARVVYQPAAPYWYALEVNLGWFVQHGVGVGQQMTFCLGGITPPAEEEQQARQAIDEINAGDHGPITAPQVVGTCGTTPRPEADLSIDNETGYPLSVFLDGPTVRSVTINPGSARSLPLQPGLYDVAARSTSSDVTPFSGQWDLSNCPYGYRALIAPADDTSG